MAAELPFLPGRSVLMQTSVTSPSSVSPPSSVPALLAATHRPAAHNDPKPSGSLPPPPAAFPPPLSRYLPLLPPGIVSTWLGERLPRGAWVLDPFGASPFAAVEAARAGYRVLVTANNPVARFLLEASARPPSAEDLRAALADLAATFKGDERMELHIQALYLTECARCGVEVMADAFLWERDAAAPYARLYHCPRCGDEGERPATHADVQRAAQFASSSLHRARALERVAPLDDPDRPYAEEALAMYLPRALYALFTLLNKLESLPPARRLPQTALLLSACDQANTLWPYPVGRARPRQLSAPPRFRENNLWLALEDAVEQWAALGHSGGSGAPARPPVVFSLWPELPPFNGGICLFEGRLKELDEGPHQDAFAQVQIEAVLGSLPRPNQAYWSLSALWAGWLWGRAAAAAFKSVLRRRRYDWAWHCTALQAAFNSLAGLVRPATPFLGLTGEAEPGLLSAALLGAHLARFQLAGLALRPESAEAQFLWIAPPAVPGSASTPAGATAHATVSPAGSPEATSPGDFSIHIQESCAAAAQAFLLKRGEPVEYLPLHAAALAALVGSGPELTGLPLSAAQPPADVFAQVHAALPQAFSYRRGFVRFGGSETSLEVGRWWLRDGPAPGRSAPAVPLSDRVEMALVNYLQKNPGCTTEDIDAELCRAFPGLLTPSPALVQACLEAYGQPDPPGSAAWRLRSQDAPRARRKDLASLKNLLLDLGSALGFTGEATPEGPVLWHAPGESRPRYAFHLTASAVLGKILLSPPGRTAGQMVLVYPGSRASLISLKLRADPRLSAVIAEDWKLVKFRHLRRLAGSPALTAAAFAEQLDLDPLTSTASQIPLL